MSLQIGNITFDCREPERVAQFWASALGYALDDVPADERTAWAAAGDPRGAGPRLYFQQVPEGKVVKNRVHLDLSTPDMATEVARLEGLGARPGRRFEEGGATWTTMFDPEGNEFCVCVARAG